MATYFTDEGLLDYLEGEPDVLMAAALFCDVVSRTWVCRASLAVVRELFGFILVEAGATPDNLPEISSAFMFAHHRSCEIGRVPHVSIDESGGLSDLC